MRDGYIKVGCNSFDVNVGSPLLNTKNIVQKIVEISTRKYFLCQNKYKANL